MVYKIYRTSAYCAEGKPCEKAFLIEGKGCRKVWGIEISSLEDIDALIKETGNSIIFGNNGELEIYDTYRE